jgi:predicted Fe-Mo cluster-binding NifX family protein
MKIAVITDDGTTISQHFGRAAHYLVATIQEGQIIQRELRDKLNHAQLKDQPHAEEQPGQKHGMDPASHDKHLRMSESIVDCEVVICRGMGMGAHKSMKSRGIRPVMTDIANIDEAVMAFVTGKLVDQVDLLH